MRVCIEKSTGKLIESQSGGENQEHLDTLIQNAINTGYAKEDVEVKFVDDAELSVLIESSKTPEQVAAEEAAAAAKIAKAQAFIDNLPRWALVETTINNIGNLADAKAFLLKLARVTYWLAKNTEE